MRACVWVWVLPWWGGAVQVADLTAKASRALEAQEAWVASTRAFHAGFSLAQDVPTGTTPAKKAYPVPSKFSATSPHATIIARFRAQQAAGGFPAAAAAAGAGAGAGTAALGTEEVHVTMGPL